MGSDTLRDGHTTWVTVWVRRDEETNTTKQDGNGTTDGASRQGPVMVDIRLGVVVFFLCVFFNSPLFLLTLQLKYTSYLILRCHISVLVFYNTVHVVFN